MSLLLSLLCFAHPASAQETVAVPVKAAQPAQILWRRDYNEARREQEEKKTPILIDFYTSSCYWCDRMDATTFKDPAVIALVNSRMLPLKVDGSRERSLATYLGIDSFPTFVIAGADGKVIKTIVGYQESVKFLEELQRVTAAQTTPDWMEQDLAVARKWFGKGETALAISTLRKIIEDGKSRPVQTEARKLLEEIDGKASQSLLAAREMANQGKRNDAIKMLSETIVQFPGTQAAKDGKELLTRLAQAASDDEKQLQRAQAARELLAQARDFYKKEEYVLCMDRCARLTDQFLDLPEGTEALQLTQELRNNPEWLQHAADTLSDRLGRVYLDLAEALLKKGQPQRAEFYLSRVIQSLPGSRLAESAQIRLGQLQGSTAKVGEKAP
jgi:thioredoxin-like negative regulator of GroEL